MIFNGLLNNIQVFLGQANGTFVAASRDGNNNTLGLGHAWNGDLTKVYVGDFNGDGRSDILRQEKGIWASENNLNTIQVFLGQTNGTFLASQRDGNSNTVGLGHAWNGDLTNAFIGDFNGDGKNDILRQEKGIWEYDDINMIQVFLGQGNGTFIASPQDSNNNTLGLGTPWKANYTNIRVGDFNGDGRSDILRQEQGEWASADMLNTIQVFLGQSNGTFSIAPRDTNGNAVGLGHPWDGLLAIAKTGDFNGDGLQDILRQETGAWAKDAFMMIQVYLSR